MDSPVFLPGIRGLKITLVAGLALLTTDALFAQSADQSSVDSLKSQMNQMQRQYEQRIEAMEAKMKTLESNANSGSILNARVLTDADGKAVAPAPMLDESFLKSPRAMRLKRWWERHHDLRSETERFVHAHHRFTISTTIRAP